MDDTGGTGRGVRWSEGGPFAIVPAWILHAEVSDRAVRLFAVLARYADQELKATPKRKTLAERLGCGTTALDAAIAELRKIGALTVNPRKRPTDGGWTSNEYVLHVVQRETSTAPAGEGSTAPAGDKNESHREREVGEANASPTRTTKPRPRDPLWDVFDELLGEVATPSERGRRNKALKELRAVDATPEELRARIRAYRRRWPNVELTESAVAANWTKLARPPGSTPGRRSRSEQAEAWVRAVGWQYPDGALAEELAKRVDDDGDRRRLKKLAASLQKEE